MTAAALHPERRDDDGGRDDPCAAGADQRGDGFLGNPLDALNLAERQRQHVGEVDRQVDQDERHDADDQRDRTVRRASLISPAQNGR